jgi:hypothetical protein
MAGKVRVVSDAVVLLLEFLLGLDTQGSVLGVSYERD